MSANHAQAGLNRLNRTTIMAIGVTVALVIGLCGFWQLGPMTALDNAFLDGLQRYASPTPRSRATVVVDIDETSLSAVGQWPWPRYKVATLIGNISALHPAAIGLDVIFPEPDRSSINTIRKTFKDDFDVDLPFADVPAGLQDNDGYLGDQIARSGAVAAHFFLFDHYNKSPVPLRTGVSIDGRTDLLTLATAPGVLSNTEAIARQSRVSGFINNQPDGDGVVRRLPLLIAHDGKTYANLGVATVMKALGVATATVESDEDGLSLKIANHRIPIDGKGFALLKFRGRSERYESISAVDVLNGNVAPDAFEGRVVFIGSSAAGLNDFYNTAVELRFPGLKTHAVMAENVLTDDVVRTPDWSRWAILAECLAVGLAMSFVFVAIGGVYPALIGSALIATLLIAVGVVSYTRAGLLLSPMSAICVVGALFVFFFVARFAIEKRRAARWYRQLENARQVTMESMASVAETRDPETGAHIKRTQHYVKAVAEQLKREGRFRTTLTNDYIRLLFLSAPLHDIGKVGVPDHILLKPGRLTPEEMVQMRRHAEFGRQIITSTSKGIEGDNFLVVAGEIAATHHERWDGEGYPVGLKGEAIPLSGRIMAVADIYDALISRRCYKDPFSHGNATEFMREKRGEIFDPVVLDAFFAIEAEIQSIAALYSDEAEEHPDQSGIHEHSGNLVPA